MATDWTSSYGVSFEYWEVDKNTFRDMRRLYAVEECEITRDSSEPTLGSATMTLGEFLDEETYIRVYLLAEQPASSGNVERVCLGTFLAQTPTAKMDGKLVERPLELSTPLKELEDDMPPIGYTVSKNSNAIDVLKSIFSRGHVKVADSTTSKTVPKDITANDSDTWLTLGRAVLDAVGMEANLDPYGTVSFAPVRDAGAMAESWTYADDFASILMPEVELTCDWHKVPNVVEVVLSQSSGLVTRTTSTNSDNSSPVSTSVRGRTVKERVSNPEGVVTAEQAAAYANAKLRELSNAEREVTYTHGYCPVKLGDCVRLYYREHSFDCKAKVVRQVIRCRTDFDVEESAVFSEVLWNG